MDKKDHRKRERFAAELKGATIDREILQAIFEASPVGMILLDENTNVLTANRAISAIVLKEPGEVIGQHGGGALNCIYSFENEKGCGFSQACPDCPLRKQILSVLVSGTPVHGFEIQPTLRLDGCDHHPWLRINAEPVVLNGRKHVLVAIDDITGRKRIEEELFNEREHLKTILDAIGAPVFYKDMQGLYLGCNDAFCRFLGLPQDKILGKTVFDIAPRPLAEIYHQADQEMYQSKTDQKYETCVRNTEGELRHVVFQKTPFRNADGEMIGIVGVILDITERKHSEELLRESEELQRALIASAPLAVICIDPAGKIMSWNAAAERIFGWKEEDVLGKTPPYINDLQMEDYAAYMKRVLEGETLTRIELTRQHKDGTPLTVSLSSAPIHNSDGEVVTLLSILEDITQRKHAEEELHRNQAVLSGIIESSDFPIFAIDTQYCYLAFNKSHAESMTYLYHVNVEVGMNLLECHVPAGGAQKAKENLDRAMRGECVHVQVYAGNINKRCYDVVHNPIYSADGRIIGVSVFAADITRQREIEAQTEAFHQKLSHASKLSTLGEMASSIAHEINQPLCSIVTHSEACLQMISLKTYNPKTVCEILETVVKQSHRAGEICYQIKNFMRKTPPNPTDVNINTVIQNTLTLMHKQIEHNGCNVELDLDTSLPLLFVDVVQIEQVLVNIITNALDAIVSESRKPLIIISASSRSEKEIEIKICDNGKGLSNKNKKEIFERFFTTKKDGLGLGLPISKSIIESYGGRIYIESNPNGIGVTVGIIFPIRN